VQGGGCKRQLYPKENHVKATLTEDGEESAAAAAIYLTSVRSRGLGNTSWRGVVGEAGEALLRPRLALERGFAKGSTCGGFN
jgi:hypothetical protein